jgi:hypothetical protein
MRRPKSAVQRIKDYDCIFMVHVIAAKLEEKGCRARMATRVHAVERLAEAFGISVDLPRSAPRRRRRAA